MAFELPSDLIQQAKILTRTEAGLPDYLPDDPSLPAMPSLSATVAAFDPSPPYLRCKRCQGRLLRGLQSLICIYCGHKLHQNPDVAPDPISFKSTVGYQWFLQALRLDGSVCWVSLSETHSVCLLLYLIVLVASCYGIFIMQDLIFYRMFCRLELEFYFKNMYIYTEFVSIVSCV